MNVPKWLEKAVFYNIYPQSFYDSNGDGIGDLAGITEKLDYIEYMGYTALWLNPFYESPFNDAGYDVTDFYKVADRYGTIDDFKKLCKSAHEKGIKVCIDLVAGHTSMECEWFKKSALAEKNEYTNRYIWTDNWLKGNPAEFIGGYGERSGMYMKNFFYCQPALNYGYANIDDPSWQLPPEHPDCIATKNELLNIIDYWIGAGADGFRVDMAPSLIKNDYDGAGIKKFWNEIRRIFDKKYPDCILISEWSEPKAALPAGFHIDFLIHNILPGYTKLFRAESGRSINDLFIGSSFFSRDGNGNIEDFLCDYLNEYERTKDIGYISIPTGNHDLPRISYLREKDDLECVYTFIMTMPGVPFVYYGDEIGMPYIKDLPSKEGGYERTGSRTPMQWKKGKNAGFSQTDEKNLYLPVNENGVNVQQQKEDETSLLNTLKKLIALRKSSSALAADGGIEFLNRKYNGYPLVYRRTSNEEEFIIAINPTDKVQEFEFNFERYAAIMHNKDVILKNDRIIMPPVSCSLIKKQY